MGWVEQNINKDIADYLFNVRINCLPERIGVFQRDMRPDLLVDFENLEDQLEQTPGMLAFWDLLLAEQKAKVAQIQREIETSKGSVTKRVLQEARENETTIRTSDLKDILNADIEIIANYKKLIEEELIESKLRVVVKCLAVKSEHLRSLAGFKREEKRVNK